jgi:hypothetical protein
LMLFQLYSLRMGEPLRRLKFMLLKKFSSSSSAFYSFSLLPPNIK